MFNFVKGTSEHNLHVEQKIPCPSVSRYDLVNRSWWHFGGVPASAEFLISSGSWQEWPTASEYLSYFIIWTY